MFAPLNASERRQMPKEEIEASAFLSKNPALDGRGILVAVMDTGVDPGAEGLQSTPDGKAKIVDVIDCTGAGDVDTSTAVAPSEVGTLKGVSGRTLSLPPSWPPIKPESKYMLGVKRAFELYPRGLEGRVKAERRKKTDAAQRDAVAACAAALTSKPDESTPEKKKMSEELSSRETLLKKLEEDTEDVGPLYDVIAYLGADDIWRVCIDTSENGDLASSSLLAPFRLEHRYATLDPISLLNYAVDVLDEGRRVVITVDAGAHGTHVAGIIGAHFPEKPELNGVAPGCQIIGLKIGDTRLDGMETGSALVRALGVAIERGVNLINLSYGEYSNLDNYGRFVDMCRIATNKHGIIFVTSAGNKGPALTTGGAPGTSDCCIAVGAFASQQMMQPQYALRSTNTLSDIQYTWSSRGPCSDGAELVSVSAPGGAIAPVPNHTLNRRMLMNGTSMASPNACGGIALLLCSLKARGATWSTRRVRMAIEATALNAANATGVSIDRWALGRGLIQVEAANEWLRVNAAEPLADVLMTVSATVHGKGTARDDGRGIYLREPQHTAGEVGCSAMIKPVLHEDAPNAQKLTIDFSATLTSSAPWVSCAPLLPLTFGGKPFDIKISCGALPPGVHYADVVGHDASKPSLGPLFRVPITVVIPHANLLAPPPPLNSALSTQHPAQLPPSACTFGYEPLPFTPGHVERRFVVPPLGATWATISLEATAAPRSRELASGGVVFMLHSTQILPSTGLHRTEKSLRLALGIPTDEAAPPTQFVESVPVTGGVTMEITIAQWWASLGETSVSMRVEFYGLEPSTRSLTLDGRQLFSELMVHAPFRRTPADPAGSLTTLVRGVRPHAAKLLPPLQPISGAPGVGDQWPESRVLYDYVLAYKFSLKESIEASVRFPSLSCHLYESPYEAQLWAVFDSNKRLVTYGDFYASPKKLPPGDYEVRLQVRHEKADLLTKLRHMPMALHLTLSSAVNLKFHWSRADALGIPPPDKPPSRVILEANARLALYVSAPSLPELAVAGDTLSGSFNLAKLSPEALGATKRPSGFAVTLVVPPAEIKDDKKEAESKDGEDDPASEKVLDEAVRALRITQLGTLSAALKKLKAAAEADKKKAEEGGAAAEAEAKADDKPKMTPAEVRTRYGALLASLKAECAAAGATEQTLTLMGAHLTNTESLCDRKKADELRELASLSDVVVALIDRTALAAAFGVTLDKDDKEAQKLRKKDDAKKKALVSALHTKALALADLHAVDAAALPLSTLDEAVAALHQWAAPSEHVKLTVRWHKLRGRFATALVALNESLDKEKSPVSKENLELKAELLDALGWAHWATATKALIPQRFPAAYPAVYNRLA